MTTIRYNSAELATDVPDALVLQVLRPLVGNRRNVFVDVPGRAGSWIFPEQPGDRTLTVFVDITSATFAERRAAVRALAYWADIGATGALIVDDEPDRYHEAILDAGVDVSEWLTYTDPFSIPFRVGPYALAVLPSTESIAIAGASPESGSFIAPDTVEALPVIEITPTNGTITGFTFTLGTSSLDFAETILDDQTVTISSISDVVTRGASTDVDLTGAFNPAAVAMASISGEFPRITEGTNTWSLVWTGTATAITVLITWRERFR